MDKGMTQFAFKGLGVALPFMKEDRKELAPQISSANSIGKSNPLISHPALAHFLNLNYFPHTVSTCSSSLCEIFQHNSGFKKKNKLWICCRQPQASNPARGWAEAAKHGGAAPC